MASVNLVNYNKTVSNYTSLINKPGGINFVSENLFNIVKVSTAMLDIPVVLNSHLESNTNYVLLWKVTNDTKNYFKGINLNDEVFPDHTITDLDATCQMGSKLLNSNIDLCAYILLDGESSIDINYSFDIELYISKVAEDPDIVDGYSIDEDLAFHIRHNMLRCPISQRKPLGYDNLLMTSATGDIRTEDSETYCRKLNDSLWIGNYKNDLVDCDATVDYYREDIGMDGCIQYLGDNTFRVTKMREDSSKDFLGIMLSEHLERDTEYSVVLKVANDDDNYSPNRVSTYYDTSCTNGYFDDRKKIVELKTPDNQTIETVKYFFAIQVSTLSSVPIGSFFDVTVHVDKTYDICDEITDVNEPCKLAYENFCDLKGRTIMISGIMSDRLNSLTTTNPLYLLTTNKDGSIDTGFNINTTINDSTKIKAGDKYTAIIVMDENLKDNSLVNTYLYNENTGIAQYNVISLDNFNIFENNFLNLVSKSVSSIDKFLEVKIWDKELSKKEIMYLTDSFDKEHNELIPKGDVHIALDYKESLKDKAHGAEPYGYNYMEPEVSYCGVFRNSDNYNPINFSKTKNGILFNEANDVNGVETNLQSSSFLFKKTGVNQFTIPPNTIPNSDSCVYEIGIYTYTERCMLVFKYSIKSFGVYRCGAYCLPHAWKNNTEYTYSVYVDGIYLKTFVSVLGISVNRELNESIGNFELTSEYQNKVITLVQEEMIGKDIVKNLAFVVGPPLNYETDPQVLDELVLDAITMPNGTPPNSYTPVGTNESYLIYDGFFFNYEKDMTLIYEFFGKIDETSASEGYILLAGINNNHKIVTVTMSLNVILEVNKVLSDDKNIMIVSIPKNSEEVTAQINGSTFTLNVVDTTESCYNIVFYLNSGYSAINCRPNCVHSKNIILTRLLTQREIDELSTKEIVISSEGISVKETDHNSFEEDCVLYLSNGDVTDRVNRLTPEGYDTLYPRDVGYVDNVEETCVFQIIPQSENRLKSLFVGKQTDNLLNTSIKDISLWEPYNDAEFTVTNHDGYQHLVGTSSTSKFLTVHNIALSENGKNYMYSSFKIRNNSMSKNITLFVAVGETKYVISPGTTEVLNFPLLTTGDGSTFIQVCLETDTPSEPVDIDIWYHKQIEQSSIITPYVNNERRLNGVLRYVIPSDIDVNTIFVRGLFTDDPDVTNDQYLFSLDKPVSEERIYAYGLLLYIKKEDHKFYMASYSTIDNSKVEIALPDTIDFSVMHNLIFKHENEFNVLSLYVDGVFCISLDNVIDPMGTELNFCQVNCNTQETGVEKLVGNVYVETLSAFTKEMTSEEIKLINRSNCTLSYPLLGETGLIPYSTVYRDCNGLIRDYFVIRPTDGYILPLLDDYIAICDTDEGKIVIDLSKKQEATFSDVAELYDSFDDLSSEQESFETLSELTVINNNIVTNHKNFGYYWRLREDITSSTYTVRYYKK